MAALVDLALENLSLSTSSNEEFVYCLRDWRAALKASSDSKESWTLLMKSVVDRIYLELGSYTEYLSSILQVSYCYTF